MREKARVRKPMSLVKAGFWTKSFGHVNWSVLVVSLFNHWTPVCTEYSESGLSTQRLYRSVEFKSLRNPFACKRCLTSNLRAIGRTPVTGSKQSSRVSVINVKSNENIVMSISAAIGYTQFAGQSTQLASILSAVSSCNFPVA